MSAGIDCPRAQTAMTPCIARDGRAALDYGTCVGCSIAPIIALAELAQRWPAARRAIYDEPLDDNGHIANLLRDNVSDYTRGQVDDE